MEKRILKTIKKPEKIYKKNITLKCYNLVNNIYCSPKCYNLVYKTRIIHNLIEI